jgi:hypothetical protein
MTDKTARWIEPTVRRARSYQKGHLEKMNSNKDNLLFLPKRVTLQLFSLISSSSLTVRS